MVENIVAKNNEATVILPVTEGSTWIIFSKEDIEILDRKIGYTGPYNREEKITFKVNKKGKHLIRFEKKIEWGIEPLDVKIISFEVENDS